MEEIGKRIIMSIGGHHSRRKQQLYRFRNLPNTKLKLLHCSRYLPLNKFKRFFRSQYLHTKIIETYQLFFLLLSLIKGTVYRSHYGIKQKKWNGKIVSVTLIFKKMERLRRSRYLVF
jgi:hypothetical protein